MKLSALLFTAILFFSYQSSFAQINLGLKFGSNYNFNGYESDSLNLSFENAVSFQGGAFVRIKIKKISIQAEGLFTGRKGEVINLGPGQKINFYSFDVPLIIGYKIMDLKVAKIRLNVGLIPSFNLSNGGDLLSANYKDSFYSGTAGVSLDIPLFLFDLRYQGAIGDYYELKGVNQSTKLTNSLLTLSVAWKII